MNGRAKTTSSTRVKRWRHRWIGPIGFAIAAIGTPWAVSSMACAPVEVEDQRRELLRSWGEDFLVPTYGVAADRAYELAIASQAFCQTPTVAGLDELRTHWHASRAAWRQTLVFRFGPYADEPIRLGPKIDAWPARPDAVEDLLATDVPITSELVATLGVFARGYPAVEYVLWGDGADPWAQLSTDQRRCGYLVAATIDLYDRLRELASVWDPRGSDYLSELTEAGRTSESFDSLHVALGEVVNRMGFLVEDIRADNLGAPLGTTTGTGPQPGKVESRFAGRGVQDIRDNIDGLDRMFFGDADGARGLDDYLRWRGNSFGPRMKERLDAARVALDQITVPLGQAIVEQPQAVQHAIDELGVLQRFIQVDVINALSLTLIFNDNDGD